MKVLRSFDVTHPLLQECHSRIQDQIISKHNAPFKLFETGRIPERQQALIEKGRTKSSNSCHFFDMDSNPIKYATAMDYVYYNNGWSWNLRNQLILSWYILFGHMVITLCPELEWDGLNRESTNYNHFQLSSKYIDI